MFKEVIIRFAPINGSEAANYFERMAYIEERFYESVTVLSMILGK